MTPAFAHGEVTHNTAMGTLDILLEWTLDPTFVIPMLLALFYFKGLRSYRLRGGTRISLWRGAAFGMGVFVIAIALLSPVDYLADRTFTFHMVQHELLVMVAVPLVLLGAPFIPVIRGLPEGFRQRWFVPFARNSGVRATLKFLTRPLVGFGFLVTNMFFWHLPPFYNTALTSDFWHYVSHFCYLFVAVLFWWHIVTPFPFPSSLPLLFRVLLLAVSGIPNTILGAMITLADEPLYGYGSLQGMWGLSPHHEQQLGGALMWTMGSMLRLMVITILFYFYAVQENAKEPNRGGGSTGK